jgi:hypothetical protein
MRPLSMLLGALLTLITACNTFRTSDFPLIVQLPASKECFEIKVLSREERRYLPATCEKIKQRAILLTSEAWKLIKTDIQLNCQSAKCSQLSTVADGLFLSLDEALKGVPGF